MCEIGFSNCKHEYFSLFSFLNKNTFCIHNDKFAMNHDVRTKIRGRVHSLNFIVEEVWQYRDSIISFKDINMKHMGVQLSYKFIQPSSHTRIKVPLAAYLLHTEILNTKQKLTICLCWPSFCFKEFDTFFRTNRGREKEREPNQNPTRISLFFDKHNCWPFMRNSMNCDK